MKTREEYIDKAKGMLDELNRDIGKFESEVSRAESKTKESYESTLAELKTKRKEVLNKIDGLKQASEDNLDNLKAGMELVLEDLRLTSDAVIERFVAMK